jgi:hypothetical protein
MEKNNDLFTRYMEFVDLPNQEAPAIYHRWTLASVIGTLLGRQFYLPLGKFTIYPNQFIMLMGTPGTRKGSAMNIGKEILKGAGYGRFSASRTSLERFLIDMRQLDINPDTDIEALSLDTPSESYIFAGEFVDFIGPNDIPFINLLTNLWDNLHEYKHPKIAGKSVEVYKPTVNLFGGSTPQTFAIAFPPEVIGTGFTSRLLLIHAEPTGKQIAWPAGIDELQKEQLIATFKDIRETIVGDAIVDKEARAIAEAIYKAEIHIDDSRFAFYQQRRYVHMLKLAIIIAAGELSQVITAEHILRANTMLAMAEKKMPHALGEFGQSRYALVANEILQFLKRRTKPANVTEIFKAVSRSISKLPELIDVLQNLTKSDKIQVIEIQGKHGYMTKYDKPPEWDPKFLDLSWLTDEEKI